MILAAVLYKKNHIFNLYFLNNKKTKNNNLNL